MTLLYVQRAALVHMVTVPPVLASLCYGRCSVMASPPFGLRAAGAIRHGHWYPDPLPVIGREEGLCPVAGCLASGHFGWQADGVLGAAGLAAWRLGIGWWKDDGMLGSRWVVDRVLGMRTPATAGTMGRIGPD